jgi:hypothetical protein
VSITSQRITYDAPDAPTVAIRDFRLASDLSDLQNIEMAVSGTVHEANRTGSLQGELSLRDAFTEAGEPQLAEGTIQASGNVKQLPVTAVDRLLQQDGRLVAMIGPILNAQLDVPQSPIPDLNATLTAESEHLQNLNMELARAGDQLQAGGSNATYRVTPEVIAAFQAGQATGERAQLQQPFTLELNVEQLTMPRPTGEMTFQAALQQAQGNVQLTATPIQMQLPRQGPVALTDTRITWQSPQLRESFTATLAGQVSAAGETGPYETSVTIRDPMSETPSGVLTAKQAPIVIADALAGQQGRLVATIGEALDARLSVKPVAAAEQAGEQPLDAWRIDGTLQSSQLQAPLVGLYREPGHLQLKTAPNPIQLTLPAQAVNMWLSQRQAAQPNQGQTGPTAPAAEPMALRADGPMRLTLQINPLELRMKEGGGINYAESGIVATATIDKASLVNPNTGQHYTVPGTIEIKGRNLRKPIQAVIDLLVQQVQPQGGQSAPQRTRGEGVAPATQPANAGGKIQSTITVAELVGAEGELQPGRASINGQAQVDRVPSTFVDALAGQGGTLAAILGSYTSVRANVEKALSGGSGELTLKSDNVTGELVGNLSEDQVLTLRKDAPVAVAVTPAVADALLSRINPFLGSIVDAQSPLKLTVEQEAFRVPLENFALSKVTLAAQLEEARVILAPEGIAQVVMGLLAQANVLQRQSQYEATLLPVDVSFKNGVVAYDQFGIALSGVVLSFAGSANLETERLDMRMTLAGSELPSALRGLEVPLAGTISNPKLEERKLVEAIGRQGIQALIQRGLGEALKRQGDREKQDQEGQRQRNGGGLLDDLLGGNRQGNEQDGQQRGSDQESNQQQQDQQDQQQQDEGRPANPFESIFERLRQRPDNDRNQKQQDN